MTAGQFEGTGLMVPMGFDGVPSLPAAPVALILIALAVVRREVIHFSVALNRPWGFRLSVFMGIIRVGLVLGVRALRLLAYPWIRIARCNF